MRIATLVPVLVFGALVGCDGGGPGAVGAPCNTADDCESGLICDEHNGQASCQEPHSHTGGETESTSDSSTTGHSHDTEDHETHGSEGSSSEGMTSEGSSSEGSSSTGAGDTTGDDSLCAAFCGCMETACSSFEAYPYADQAACITACESLDEATLQCFGGFCQQASDDTGSLAEHYCEHAWGELGTEKC